jgi:hypothetical protein
MAIRGENYLVRIDMLQSDGETPLLLSACESISVKVIQGSVTLASYVYGTDPEVRQGESTSQLEVEITKAVSQKFRTGSVYLKLTVQETDAEFVVDEVHRDIDLIEILDVD